MYIYTNVCTSISTGLFDNTCCGKPKEQSSNTGVFSLGNRVETCTDDVFAFLLKKTEKKKLEDIKEKRKKWSSKSKENPVPNL